MWETGADGVGGVGGVHLEKQLHAKQSFVFLLNYNCRGGGVR